MSSNLQLDDCFLVPNRQKPRQSFG